MKFLKKDLFHLSRERAKTLTKYGKTMHKNHVFFSVSISPCQARHFLHCWDSSSFHFKIFGMLWIQNDNATIQNRERSTPKKIEKSWETDKDVAKQTAQCVAWTRKMLDHEEEEKKKTKREKNGRGCWCKKLDANCNCNMWRKFYQD